MDTTIFPLIAVLAGPVASPSVQRPLKVDDLFALKDVADPRLSPDGRWVAYTVKSLDAKTDRADADIFMAPIDSGEPVRLTTSKKTEDHPRFSPDGKWLAFLSDREGKKTQVFLLSRAGGEAVRLTDFPGGVSDLAWSPDGQRLALLVSDPNPDEPAEEPAAGGEEEGPAKKPLVIVRRQFKRDGEGYLREVRKHIHLFDLVGKKSLLLTSGPFDDSEPAWSPDGQQVAFVSNRSLPDPDASQDTEIFVVDARAGAIPLPVSHSPGTDAAPVFSPDGQWIAYLAGGDPKDMWYGANHLALVSTNGRVRRPLTASLDRNLLSPRFSPDGRFVYFLLEEGGNQPLARVPVGGGPVERVVAGEREIQAFDLGPRGEVVVLETSPQQPAEVSRLEADGRLSRVTRVNDEFLKGLRLGEVRRFQAKSADGTPIDGFVTLPPTWKLGEKLPAILRIHGGPTMQYSTAFEFQWQALAAGGYAVIAANPRGSTGYGTAFSRAIWADWGNKDFDDVMAAVDHVVGLGVADPERLGVGGWSYGGMLTDYIITKTNRFKAAVSGASEANYLANYGTDHYQYEWETELGLPWKATELWLRLSPWFQVEKVQTPTLILCGDADQNVPLLNSEQLYQALRRLGKVDTELVVYPGEAHDIERPSYQTDRLERYLAWYDRYLKPAKASGAPPLEAISLMGRPLHSPPIPEARKKTLEADLQAAMADFVKDPQGVGPTIWLARRTAYLGRYREAIAVLSRGLDRHPNDARLLRHRGHRYITVRELDKGVADLERAASLVRGRPDEIEPDGVPNPQNRPVSTLQFNIWYHLGLAHYLKGDFAKALPAYRECLRLSAGSPDRLVAAADWLYLTLCRLGRKAEADAILASLDPNPALIENHAYLNRLRLYQGLFTSEDLLRAGGGPVGEPTYGYAVGVWHLLKGESDRAKDAFLRTAKGPEWSAFGVIAAEAELARMR
ncbi:MAG TPA: prolyl oligopeptidase family serine peptidase [Vicinamibacteria bacterium]|nr:prolyl oligopeptidase family serine peptidase [Vicinamibacteria bacterium]